MSHNYVAQEVFNDKLIIRVSRRENTDNSVSKRTCDCLIISINTWNFSVLILSSFA